MKAPDGGNLEAVGPGEATFGHWPVGKANRMNEEEKVGFDVFTKRVVLLDPRLVQPTVLKLRQVPRSQCKLWAPERFESVWGENQQWDQFMNARYDTVGEHYARVQDAMFQAEAKEMAKEMAKGGSSDRHTKVHS